MQTNDAKKIQKIVVRLKEMVEKEVYDVLPRKVGVLAVNHFKQNFRDSGFMDGGLKPWQKSKRELSGGKDAKSRYKTLTSARNHLMSSTQSQIGKGEVIIENPVPYAEIHNEGGTINSNPAITPKMRKFAWAMVYKISGRKGRKGKKGKRRKNAPPPPPLPAEAEKWKALALTKKTRLHIKAKMPKRQFMGESKELTAKINKAINETITKIQNGISAI